MKPTHTTIRGKLKLTAKDIYYAPKNYFFYKKAITRPIISICQMGKVSSMSIWISLARQYDGYCFHTHTPGDYRPSSYRLRNFYKRIHGHQHKIAIELLQQRKLPIKLISMVREPISRSISSFFEHFKYLTEEEFIDKKYSLKQLLDIFLKNTSHNQLPLLWMDNELKKHYGIDVYQRPFPEYKYVFFKKNNIELLLYQYDIDIKLKKKLIGDFVGIKNLKIKPTNIGSQKKYAQTYQQFKELPLPESYVNEMLSSKYAQHFYKKDIEKLRLKWTKKLKT